MVLSFTCPYRKFRPCLFTRVYVQSPISRIVSLFVESMMHRLLILLLAEILLPHGLCRAQQLTAEQRESLRAEIRENFFVPDPLPPLNPITHRRFEPAPGVVSEAVTYATQLGTRVPAILYLPKPKPKTATDRIPGFIVVNGHGGDKYSWYSYYSGVLYARAGAAVLTYDQAGEGERNASRKSGTRTHDRLKGDDVLARRLGGLMMTDVMQAVSYLCSRPEVDGQRIGAAGYSMGSFVLALTGAVEPRLRACVLVGGGNIDGVDGYWDNSKPMCQGLPYRSLRFLGDRGAVIYALHASRGPTLIYNGLADSVVDLRNLGGCGPIGRPTTATRRPEDHAGVKPCEMAKAIARPVGYREDCGKLTQVL